MNPQPSQSLQGLDRKIVRLLMLRSVVQWLTLWFFVWGVAVLAGRISGRLPGEWLALGLLGVVPLAALAIWRGHRQRPPLAKVRASYDQLNLCGGILMSEEAADMSAWQSRMPATAAPRLRWHSGRAMLLLGVSALFTATALLLPERLTQFSFHHPLEIGAVVEQLQAEVKTLEQEKIIGDKKAADLQKQLSQLQKDSSGRDPDKTWEALDHIKESNSDAARQAAEEALEKTAALTQAGTLAQAMEQAADSGMSAATASQAAQDLASLLQSAKLETGLLNGQIPPELLSGLNGLNKEQMEKLSQALQFSKNSLGTTLSNLANLKMIDPALLAQCQKAGAGGNPGALAEYLSACTNGGEVLAECLLLSNGGPGGGGPEAPMTWKNDTSEEDLKFQEHALPPAAHLADAQLIGVSRTAPELSGNEVTAGSGALDHTAASGGSAHSQVIWPEQRPAVQKFFKRDK